MVLEGQAHMVAVEDHNFVANRVETAYMAAAVVVVRRIPLCAPHRQPGAPVCMVVRGVWEVLVE